VERDPGWRECRKPGAYRRRNELFLGTGTVEVARGETHPPEYLHRVSSSFDLYSDVIDLDDIDRTKSPILLKHKFVLKVYFSVTGETVEGQQIPNANGVGHLRMLIASLPQPLPSVCARNTATRIDTDTFSLAVYMRRRMGHTTRM
jgi:hypothetical protein